MQKRRRSEAGKLHILPNDNHLTLAAPTAAKWANIGAFSANQRLTHTGAQEEGWPMEEREQASRTAPPRLRLGAAVQEVSSREKG